MRTLYVDTSDTSSFHVCKCFANKHDRTHTKAISKGDRLRMYNTAVLCVVESRTMLCVCVSVHLTITTCLRLYSITHVHFKTTFLLPGSTGPVVCTATEHFESKIHIGYIHIMNSRIKSNKVLFTIYWKFAKYRLKIEFLPI